MTPEKLTLSLRAGELVGICPAPGAQILDGDLVVLRGPGDDGVGEPGQGPCPLGLTGQQRLDDGALPSRVQVAAQRVQALTLVQLPGDFPPVYGVRQGTSRRGLCGAVYTIPPVRP
jgi:hypothetical protein